MLTPDQAQQDYEAAMSALRLVAKDPNASDGQIDEAIDAMRDLTAKYVGQIVLEVQALTRQYQDFIQAMSSVVARLSAGPSLTQGLTQLTQIVHTGGQLIG